jgi:hypothetical protein
MDNAQIEHELEDLESRLERLRALYEQYFLGMEKLEPTVLRKDVDRKLWVLRREQIRNTGLRFKFQMLIQRYNTYQQYWTRVVREIENGTYRRDIIKVAQRFGEKDAMTILGRKRAEQYRRLAANQLDRRGKRKKGAEEAETAVDVSIQEDEVPVELDADDLEVIDDGDGNEAPTPPRGMAPVRMFGEPDMDALLLAATVGVTTWDAPPRAPAAPLTEVPATSPVPTKPSAGAVKPPAAKPGASGATAAASKSRVAELAAQMRAKKEATKPAAAALELDLHVDLGAPGHDERVPNPRFTASPQPAKAPPSASSKTTKRASVAPPPQTKRASTAPPPQAPKPTQPQKKPSSPKLPATKPPAGAARSDELSEQKMREIYAKYVGAKRAANESTAGITFEKLATSLRAQADKIKSSHPSRSIDFEVVTKDGKTALRPVVK